MKTIGRILLIAGFLLAAFLASLDPETIEWIYFVPAIVVGAIGVAMIKASERALARAPELLSANRQALSTSLDRVIEELILLDERKRDVPLHTMRDEIDNRFRADLTRFADARESMIHIFGMGAYADIMSHFAAGERYINRVWSASVDGYAEEAMDYIGHSLEQFREAKAGLERALAQASSHH